MTWQPGDPLYEEPDSLGIGQVIRPIFEVLDESENWATANRFAYLAGAMHWTPPEPGVAVRALP